MQNGIRGFAMNLIMNRLPQSTRNNPNAQAMIQAIQNGDNKSGEQIAQNILQTYGVSKEEAVSQAIQFFGLGGR